LSSFAIVIVNAIIKNETVEVYFDILGIVSVKKFGI